MRRLICSLALTAAAVLPPSAHADTITTFLLNGTFVNGGTLGGTLTIDTTTGIAISAQLVLAADGINVNEFILPRGQGPSLGSSQIGFSPSTTSPGESLDLLLPVSSLVGYNGSVLCGNNTRACNFGFVSTLTAFSPGGTILDPVLTGSVTPVPEPASLGLLGTGLLGALSLFRRHIRH